MSDFYIGYLPKAPPSLAKTIVRVVFVIGVVVALVGVLLVFGQSPFAASKFEFGEYREYTGQFQDWPYPMLITRDARYLLVAPGKHGFTEAAKGTVHLKGSLIQRGQDAMLEVQPGSMQVSGVPEGPSTVLDLGTVTLAGEIVDSKCYLGVMNPGNGKVHRDCAVRCISGGIPPAFIAKDARGDLRTLLLVGTDGRALHQEVLPFVAEPIQVTGQLVRSGSTLILKTDPATFHRE